MRKSITFLLACCLLAACGAPKEKTLKSALEGKFLIGSAVNEAQIRELDTKADSVLALHFNAIEPENCMKSAEIMPVFGQYRWELADRYVEFGEKYGLDVFGHCLIWHSQCTPDFCYDAEGNLLQPEELKERMRQHITTTVSRYKGRIKGWDVVNEAIEDDGSYRKSPLYNIIGEDFIDIAFKAAHEADPDAELYYNDFSMAKPGKREAVCRLVRRLQQQGLRIDAVGMQSHNGMDYPNLADYEKSIDAFAACGVKVMMTELDLNVLPNPDAFAGASVEQRFEYEKQLNPYADGLPADVARRVEDRYMTFFNLYYKHRSQISRINLWGVADHNSWLNGWPVPGRTNYPLLFDRQYQPKPVVAKIIQLYSQNAKK